MPEASEQLECLIHQAKQLRQLIELQPSARDIDDLPQQLESDIETDEGVTAWFGRGAHRTVSDISSRVEEVRSGLEEMLSSVVDQVYDMFTDYQREARREEEPTGEYEQSLRDLSYQDWKEVFELGEARRVLSLAMTWWTPQQAERIGWIEPITDHLNPTTASYVVSRVLHERHTEVPAWWDLLSPMLTMAHKKSGELNTCLNSWVNRYAMNERGSSGGWPATTWIKKLKECGATINPHMTDFYRMFSHHDAPLARMANIHAHHEMMRGRLERLFSTEPEKFRDVFSLFCPRTSSAEKMYFQMSTSTPAKTEREALERVLELARRSIGQVAREDVDGHMLAGIFKRMDAALAQLLSDQSLPSYAVMFHELRSDLEVRGRNKIAATSSRAM